MTINEAANQILSHVQVMTDLQRIILKEVAQLRNAIGDATRDIMERDISNRADTIENDSRRDGRKVAQ